MGLDVSLKGSIPVVSSVPEHWALGTHSDALSPSELVSDSFLDAIGDLILSHKKHHVPIPTFSSNPLSDSLSPQLESLQDRSPTKDSFLHVVHTYALLEPPLATVDSPPLNIPEHPQTSLSPSL